MDRYLKFLSRLKPKDREKILEILQKIDNNDLKDLNAIKLTGLAKYYRVRFGKIRIVFKVEAGKNTLIDINYRKDIYKNLS